MGETAIVATEAELIAEFHAAKAKQLISEEDLIREFEAAQPEPEAPKRERTRGAQLFKDLVFDPAGSVLQGLTFGFGDELTAKAAGALGEDPVERLAFERQALQEFREESPILSTGLEIGAGLVPALATAGVAAPATGAGRLGQVLFGIGKTAPQGALRSVAGLAGTGATVGGLFGAGTAEEGERLPGAFRGALLGGGAAGTLGVGGQTLGALARTGPAQRFTELSRQLLGNEAGAALSSQGPKISPRLSPPETVLARQLSNVPARELAKASNRLESASRRGVPVAPVEALDKEAAFNLARLLRATDPGADIAEDVLAPRARQAVARSREILEDVAPRDSVKRGAESFKFAAEEAGGRRTAIRAGKAGRRFKAALSADNPLVESRAVNEVLESGVVKGEISRLKRKFPGDFKDLPDNHIALLDKVRKNLNDKISKAKRAGEAEEARDILTKLQQPLDDALRNASPEYREALEVFAKSSGPVNRLLGGRNPKTGKPFRGLLTDIIKAEKPRQVGRNLFGLEAEDIANVRQALGPRHRKAFQAGIRAHLDTLVDSKNGPKRLIDFAFNEDTGSKLQAALGKKQFNELRKKLLEEQQILKGDAKTFTGSKTSVNQAMSARLKNFFLRILPGGRGRDFTTEVAEELISAIPQDERAQAELARILFEQQTGAPALRRIADFQTGREAQRALIEGLGRPAGKAAGRGSGIISGR